MLKTENQTDAQASRGAASSSKSSEYGIWVALVLCALSLAWFYFHVPRYGAARNESALGWLYSAWNGETDYEHGILFPFVIAGLIIYKFKSLKASAGETNLWGLTAIVVGTVFYVAAYRTLQPRIAVAGLPFLLWGCAWYFWGWRLARLLIFPLFFFWLAVPLPSFQQATTHLQLLATSLAHHGSDLLGVETYVEGTTVLPVKGNWQPLNIAHGCSGIRSLMALLMISAAWAYVANLAMWKRALLFLMAFPLAIIGNALRVISIFVIAEYGNAEWASTTWHDWSGLLLFYPFSLFLLLVTHSVLEGGLPWKNTRKRQIRRIIIERPTTFTSPQA